MTSAFSWQNFVSLCPASFCTQRPYPCLLLQVYLDFLFLQSPIIKRISFFGVSSRRSCTAFWTPLLTMRATLFFSKGFFPYLTTSNLP